MRNVLSYVAAGVVLFGVLGCGGMWTMNTSSEKPSPQASDDKATLVIMRTTSYGWAAQISNFLDGKLIGQTKGKCYFITKVDPGKHTVICQNENVRMHEINFEAGKVYYLQQAIYMGAWSARTEYDTLNPQIFEEQKPECEYFVFSPELAKDEEDAVIDMEDAKKERNEQIADEKEYYAKIDNLKGF